MPLVGSRRRNKNNTIQSWVYFIDSVKSLIEAGEVAQGVRTDTCCHASRPELNLQVPCDGS